MQYQAGSVSPLPGRWPELGLPVSPRAASCSPFDNDNSVLREKKKPWKSIENTTHYWNICTFLIVWSPFSAKNIYYLLDFLNNREKSPLHFLITYAHNSIFPICNACLRPVICYLLVPIDFLLPLLSFTMSVGNKHHDLYQPSSTNH